MSWKPKEPQPEGPWARADRLEKEMRAWFAVGDEFEYLGARCKVREFNWGRYESFDPRMCCVYMDGAGLLHEISFDRDATRALGMTLTKKWQPDVHRCEHCDKGIDAAVGEAVREIDATVSYPGVEKAGGLLRSLECPHCKKMTRV